MAFQPYKVIIGTVSGSTFTPVATAYDLVSLDKQGTILHYERKLSSPGKCRFRLQTKDPIFQVPGSSPVQYQAITTPFQYHVQVYRGSILVWRGVIIDNPHQTQDYIEVEARTYLYSLSRIEIVHDKLPDGSFGPFKTWKSGGMDTAVTALFNDAKAKTNSPISVLTLGTIENPVFAANTTNAGKPFAFSDSITLQLDFKDTLYAMEVLAQVGIADFYVGLDNTFNFVKKAGNPASPYTFFFGVGGQIDDFDAPRSGTVMANHIDGICANKDVTGNSAILQASVDDNTSQGLYGRLWTVAAFNDITSLDLLKGRIGDKLRVLSTPDTELKLLLNSRWLDQGQFQLGDVVNIRINWYAVQVNSQRRIVGWTVAVKNTFEERVTLVTNVPRT